MITPDRSPSPALLDAVADVARRYLADRPHVAYDAYRDRSRLVAENVGPAILAPILWRAHVRAAFDEDARQRFVRLDADGRTATPLHRDKVLRLAATVVANLPTLGAADRLSVREAVEDTRRLVVDRERGAAAFVGRVVEAAFDALRDVQEATPGADTFTVEWPTLSYSPPSVAPERERAAEHLRVFLRYVPRGQHDAANVYGEYIRAAEATGIPPRRRTGRTTFYRAADDVLGPRLTGHARRSVYRVTPLSADAEAPAAPLTDKARAVLRCVIERRQQGA